MGVSAGARLGHPLAGVSGNTYSGWCPAGVGAGNRTSLESRQHTPEPQLGEALYEKVAECCCFLGPREVCACLPGDPAHREEDMASQSGAGVPTPGFTPGREKTRGPGERPQQEGARIILAGQAFSCTMAMPAMPRLPLPLFPEAKERRKMQTFSRKIWKLPEIARNLQARLSTHW